MVVEDHHPPVIAVVVVVVVVTVTGAGAAEVVEAVGEAEVAVVVADLVCPAIPIIEVCNFYLIMFLCVAAYGCFFVWAQALIWFPCATVIVRGLPSSASWQDLKVCEVGCLLF